MLKRVVIYANESVTFHVPSPTIGISFPLLSFKFGTEVIFAMLMMILVVLVLVASAKMKA